MVQQNNTVDEQVTTTQVENELNDSNEVNEPQVEKQPIKKKTGRPKRERAESSNQEQKTQYGIERTHDLPWGPKKIKIFQVLQAARAYTPDSALAASKVAEKAGVTNRDVRHYCYHAKAADLIGLSVPESGGKAYNFYLTKNGQFIDPVEELRKQEEAKALKFQEKQAQKQAEREAAAKKPQEVVVEE